MCYQPTPLKMNLVLEIQTDQKRNLEILPSTLLPFPCSFFLGMMAPLHLAILIFLFRITLSNNSKIFFSIQVVHGQLLFRHTQTFLQLR
jgi:hypothetical protein